VHWTVIFFSQMCIQTEGGHFNQFLQHASLLNHTLFEFHIETFMKFFIKTLISGTSLSCFQTDMTL
jgi:hypothetical protein